MPENNERPRYERISLLAIELRQDAEGRDGADSSLCSSDESEGECHTKRYKRKDNDHDNLDELTEDNSRLYARTAMGCGLCEDTFEDMDDCEESDIASTKKKQDAFNDVFPVRGMRCVGCALSHRIGPVETFVNTNIGRISETSLWQMAALVWKNEVVLPAKKEKVQVIEW